MTVINQVGNTLTGLTGSGKFVGDNTPTLITPILGVSAATSINFGGNALDNYTEGTWTVTMTFSTPGDLSVAYTTQTGTYTRLGRFVSIRFALVCAPTFTTASGSLRIGTLPYTVAASSNMGGVLTNQSSNIVYPVGATAMFPTPRLSNTDLQLASLGTAFAAVNLSTTGITSGTTITLTGNASFFV